MKNENYIEWIDGFFKGLSAFEKGPPKNLLSAKSVVIKGQDVVQEYQKYINDDDDDELKNLGIKAPELSLNIENNSISDSWQDILSNLFLSSFEREDKDLVQRALSCMFDVLDLVTSKYTGCKATLCSAEFGDQSGKILFLRVREEKYLVFSFMKATFNE